MRPRFWDFAVGRGRPRERQSPHWRRCRRPASGGRHRRARGASRRVYCSYCIHRHTPVIGLLPSLAFLAAWRDNAVCCESLYHFYCRSRSQAKTTSTAYLAKPPRTPRKITAYDHGGADTESSAFIGTRPHFGGLRRCRKPASGGRNLNSRGRQPPVPSLPKNVKAPAGGDILWRVLPVDSPLCRPQWGLAKVCASWLYLIQYARRPGNLLA